LGTEAFDMATNKLLISEDDPAISELLTHHFVRESFRTVRAEDGLSALRLAREGVDLIVLDIGLPGIDGLEVTRTLRREGRTTPILMLTARTEEIDRILGLELGADDYVIKPFSPREVVSRVRAILRRAGIPRESAPRLLRFGRLEIDEGAREARVDGTDSGLKPREFALLLLLANNVGVAVSRDQLLERVWGYDFNGDERTLDVHVRRLRQKIEERGKLEPCITTVHGYGYKFVDPSLR
jgi:DNA-binding response OmpR family regulator